MSAREPKPPLPEALRGLAAHAHRAFAQAAAAGGLEAPAPADLPGDAERVFALSDFVARLAASTPALLVELAGGGDLGRSYAPPPARVGGGPRALPAYRKRLAAALAGAGDPDGLMAGLRAARRREMLRIAWRDLGGLAGLEETVRDASDFADAAIGAALEHLEGWHHRRHGVPEDRAGRPQHLTVIALGKLGARELNFSSDIDLLFAYPAEGETRGARRALGNGEFFARLGRELIRVLHERTAAGAVFRVDMRLRPFGASGPLAMSFDALESYYQVHGRDWERYALIRARPVTGDESANELLGERLRPFVYRRYLDFGALESLREMKAMITEEVARRGLHDDLKLGRGGIREIEFTGQAFQMVRGGRLPELRHRSILVILERLGARGLLPGHAVAELTRAYRFLRDSEHRLQEVDDRQTHTLPGDALGRARLAAGLGLPDWDAYRRVLEDHRTRVSAHFDQVFGTSEAAGGGPPERPATLLALASDEEASRALLAACGFADPGRAWEALSRLLRARSVQLLDRRARGRLERLLPDLLRAAAGQPRGEETLARVLAIIETIARRSAYLALLGERPVALSQLVRLCAASPWIARLIGRHPAVLDELLDPRTLYAPLERRSLERELADRLAAAGPGDTEAEMAALRQFKQTNVLRVAAADVARRTPLMTVSDHLTQIAETALRAALALGRRDLVARYGEPLCGPPEARVPAPFLVVGYGKLGGLELGYGSDLDLVFLYDGEGPGQHTAGPREVDNAVFFGRLAQRLIHFLATNTPDGQLYEVDPRLRPGGASGLLVQRIAGLAEYLEREAWTWEHQALVRARPVAGDPRLARRFRALRRRVLLRPRDPEALRAEVREMRERMRAELARGGRDGFDLKHDRGGVADIEFMVQYGVLRWAARLGDYLDFTDNIRLLEGFGRAGLLAGRDVALLTDAYRAYRARAHAAALQEAEAVVAGDELGDYREAVAALWARIMES